MRILWEGRGRRLVIGGQQGERRNSESLTKYETEMRGISYKLNPKLGNIHNPDQKLGSS